MLWITKTKQKHICYVLLSKRLLLSNFLYSLDNFQQKLTNCLIIINGQCHEIFDTFLLIKKTPPGLRMNRQKRFREIFRFRKDVRENARNRFFLSIWGPDRIFSAKNGQKSRATVPLTWNVFKNICCIFRILCRDGIILQFKHSCAESFNGFLPTTTVHQWVSHSFGIEIFVISPTSFFLSNNNKVT